MPKVTLHLMNEITETPIELKTSWKTATITKVNKFVGDAEGTGASAYVGCLMPEGWKRFEGQIYFEGTLLGRKGKFVIACCDGKMVETDKVTAEWKIITESCTDELQGLTGRGPYLAFPPFSEGKCEMEIEFGPDS